MSDLHRLGRQLSALQDADRHALGGLERAGTGFVRALRRRPLHRRVGVRMLAAALVALGAVALWSRVRWLSPPIPGPMPATLTAGLRVAAPPGRAVPLDFPGGTRVLLSPGTEAQVHELSVAGARLELTRGRAAVAVHHEPNTRWLLMAGPYQVRVTGTRFDLAWSPESERLSVQMHEGSVVVTGAGDAHAAVTLVAPERLTIDHDQWQVSAGATGAAAGATPGAPRASPASSGAAATASATSGPAAPPARRDAHDWRALARAGDYAQAYAAATRRGISTLAATEPSSELLALAETCRFAGHAAEGTAVLTELRRRFPGSDDAATAAFQLGRRSRGATATGWFRTYLAERPGGPLAREASGRLLESLDAAADPVAAADAARAYLARYPAGPHAAFARRLLTR